MAKYSTTIDYNITTKLDASGIKQLQTQISAVEKELNTLASKSLIDPEQVNRSIQRINVLRNALTQAFNPKTNMLNLDGFFNQLKQSNTSLGDLSKTFNNAGTTGKVAFNNILGSISKLDTQLKTTSTSVNKIFTTLGNTVRWGLIASAFQTVMNSAHEAVQYMKDLDKSLTDIQMVGHSSAEDMRELALQANEAAKALGSTTTAYTDATKIFVQQGLSLEDSQAFAEMSLKLSNVAGESADEAAEQITALKNGFQMTGDAVESSLDKIVKTSHITASSVEELATASTRVAATANTLGVTDDQLYSQLSTIIQVTREAPEIVGNSLKTIYARFADLKLGETLEDGMDLGSFSGALEKIGVRVLDDNNELRDMGSIIEDLMSKWQELDRSQKQGAAVTLAGKFQYNRLMTLMENADAYKETLEKLQTDEDVEGLLDTKNTEVYLESLEGKANRLKATFEGIMTSLFDQDSVGPVIDSLSKLLDIFNQFIDAVGGGGPVLTAFAAILTKTFSNNIAHMISGGMDQINANILRQQNSNIRKNLSSELQGAQLTESQQKAVAISEQLNQKQKFMNEEELIQANEILDNIYASISKDIEAQETLNQKYNNTVLLLEEIGEINAKDAGFTFNKETSKINFGIITDQDLQKIEQQKQIIHETSHIVVQDFQALESALSNKDFSGAQSIITKMTTSSGSIRQFAQNLQDSEVKTEKWNKALRDISKIMSEYIIKINKGEQVTKEEEQAILNKINALEKQKEVLSDVIGLTSRMNQATKEGNAYKSKNEAQNDVNRKQSTQQEADLDLKIGDTLNKGLDKVLDTKKIVEGVAALGQLSFAMQSIKSMGTLWSNEDLSVNEKMLQIFANIGFTLPMLIQGFQGLKKLPLTNVFSEKMLGGFADKLALTAAGFKQEANAAKTAAGVTQGTVSKFNMLSGITAGASKAVSGLGKAFSALGGPIGVAMLAITAVTAALSYFDEQAQKRYDDAKEKAEKANESYTQTKEAQASFNETYDSFQKGTASIDDLKTAAQNCKEVFGKNLDTTALLTGSYEDLKKAIEEASDAERERVIEENKNFMATNKEKLQGSWNDQNAWDDLKQAIPDTVTYTESQGVNGTDYTVHNTGLGEKFDQFKENQDIFGAIGLAEQQIKEWQKAQKEIEEQQKGLDPNGNDYKSLQKQYELYAQQIKDVQDVLAQEEIADAKQARDQNAELLADKYFEDNNFNSDTNIQEQVNALAGTDDALGSYLTNLDSYSDQLAFLIEHTTDKTTQMALLTEKANADIAEGMSQLTDEQYESFLANVNEEGQTLQQQIEEAIRAHSDENGNMEEGYSGTVQDWVDDMLQGAIAQIENSDLSEEAKRQLEEGIPWEKSIDEIYEYLTEGLNNKLEQGSVADFANMEPIDADVDKDAFQELGKYIGENAGELEDYSEELEHNANALADVTEAQLRYDAALERSYDSIEDWEKALSDDAGARAKAEALSELTNTYNDLLDVEEGASVSAEFAANTENLDLLKAAIEGDIDAYDELQRRAAEDIFVHAGMSVDDFNAAYDNIQQMKLDLEWDDIEIGASIEDQAFLDALTNMVVAAGMTADEATAALSEMGIDATVEEDPVQSEDTQTYTNLIPDIQTKDVDVALPAIGDAEGTVGKVSIPSVTYKTEEQPLTNTKQFTGFGLEVSSSDGSKKSGGNVKVTSARKQASGGQKYKASSPAAAHRSSGGSGGGSKGGGGGSKGSSEKAYEPKKKDPIEEEIDRYERVDTWLQKIENDYDKINAEQDRLAGWDKADNMTKQIELLEDQIVLQKEKLKIQKQEAAELKNELASQYGATFDPTDGLLTNYATIHKRLADEVNNLINQYNAATTEAEQDRLDKLIEDAQKRLDKFKDKYKRYDDLVSGDIKDTEKAIEDLKDSIEDLRIEAMKTQVEAVDNLKDLQEKLIDFNAVFSGLSKDDPLRDMMTSAEKLAKYFDDGTSSAKDFYDELIKRTKDLMNKDGVSGPMKKWYQEQIKQMEAAKKAMGSDSMEAYGTGYLDMEMLNLQMILEQIKEFETTGKSSIFGENSNDLYEVAKDVFDSAADMIMDFEDAIEDLRDAILDAIDDIGDKMDERREQYELITEELEHQREIAELLRGDRNYEEINQLLRAQQKNYESSISSMKDQLDLLKDLQKGLEEGSEEWKAVQDMIVDTQKDLNDLVEDSLKNLQEIYENTVSSIGDKWIEDTLGTDLDWMQEQWEMINRNADYYLDDVNAAYNIQKLQSKYQDLLDNAGDLHTQQLITQQMAEQLGYLREKEKISEYDVQYAEMQIELLQKRIALEEAQRNKSQLKLRRDSQGNYNYVYTADTEATKDAQEALLDAQNNAYNLSKEQMRKTQEDSLSALQDARKTIDDIWTDANLTLDEKKQRTQTVIDSLKEYLDGTSEQLSTSQKNIINDFIGMVELMTDENAARLEDVYNEIIDGNNDAFDKIDTRWSDSITDWLQNMDDFKDRTDQMFDDLIDNAVDYQDQVDQVADLVEQNFNNVTDAVNRAKEATDALADSNAAFIEQLKNDAGTIKEYEKTMQGYIDKINDANNAMRAYQSQVNNLEQSLAAKERENATLSSQVQDLESKVKYYENGGTPGGGNGGSGDYGGYDLNTVAMGIAGNIWLTRDGWGNDPTRHALMRQKFGSSKGDTVYNAVQSKFNNDRYGYSKPFPNNASYYHQFAPSAFDTGGYTGMWNDGIADAKNGKLAWLHQKELVLNEDDTKNILSVVQLVREMVSGIKTTALEELGNNLNGTIPQSAAQSGTIDQTVTIEASFPNANSVTEIQQALLGLADQSLQYANRYR